MPKVTSANGLQALEAEQENDTLEYEQIRVKALKQIERMILLQKSIREGKYILMLYEKRLELQEKQREGIKEINANAKSVKAKYERDFREMMNKYEDELAPFDMQPEPASIRRSAFVSITNTQTHTARALNTEPISHFASLLCIMAYYLYIVHILAVYFHRRDVSGRSWKHRTIR